MDSTVKLSLNRHRYAPGGSTQGCVIEMDIAVGRAGTSVSKQSSSDMQAFPVHYRLGGVRMAKVM